MEGDLRLQVRKWRGRDSGGDKEGEEMEEVSGG